MEGGFSAKKRKNKKEKTWNKIEVYSSRECTLYRARIVNKK